VVNIDIQRILQQNNIKLQGVIVPPDAMSPKIKKRVGVSPKTEYGKIIVSPKTDGKIASR
jgi:hypothetical protein